jgi:glycosyltransferase involved in cell wall biosynthesis
MTLGRNYVVISPVRNEEEHLPRTIDSMLAQTVRAQRWVIVDDGSSDRTGSIAQAAAARHSWIKVLHRSDRGVRKAGGGVVETFYEGYATVEGLEYDYLIKLDGDLSFEPDYFERCFQQFEARPGLGIAGGTICRATEEGPEPESRIDPRFHVRGATKIYRQDCWRGIGGLIQAPGWDTLDEVKANMLGWETATLSDINAIHHRPTGAAYGIWNDMVKGGRANYIAGYHPVFMTIKCMKRLFDPPYLIGGTGLFWGYLLSALKRTPQVPDDELIKYFQAQQMRRLFFRKSLWSQ